MTWHRPQSPRGLWGLHRSVMSIGRSIVKRRQETGPRRRSPWRRSPVTGPRHRCSARRRSKLTHYPARRTAIHASLGWRSRMRRPRPRRLAPSAPGAGDRVRVEPRCPPTRPHPGLDRRPAADRGRRRRPRRHRRGRRLHSRHRGAEGPGTRRDRHRGGTHRPVGLAADGAAGVACALDILRRELRTTMALAGQTSVKNLERDLVFRVD
jgi:FMN-dependent dehydrogenase